MGLSSGLPGLQTDIRSAAKWAGFAVVLSLMSRILAGERRFTSGQLMGGLFPFCGVEDAGDAVLIPTVPDFQGFSPPRAGFAAMRVSLFRRGFRGRWHRLIQPAQAGVRIGQTPTRIEIGGEYARLLFG